MDLFSGPRLAGLDLFSGIGGLTLALSPWVRPVAYCELDRYAQGVLLSRMSSGDLHAAPIWDDVRTLGPSCLSVGVDILYGGFPCQDISVAGRGAGLGGERSGLFFEVARLIDELQPPFVFLENVPAIRTRGAERVVKELASRGYDCRWDTLSAHDVGAPHLRNRWWLLAARPGDLTANTERLNLWQQSGRRGRADGTKEVLAATLADAKVSGLERLREGLPRLSCDSVPSRARLSSEYLFGPHVANGAGLGWCEGRPRTEVRCGWNDTASSGPFGPEWWTAEPNVDRVVNGLPHRVDRIKGLGNAVVPAQAREAFRRLIGFAEGEAAS